MLSPNHHCQVNDKATNPRANLSRSVLVEKLQIESTYNKCERYVNSLSTKRKLFGSTDINAPANKVKYAPANKVKHNNLPSKQKSAKPQTSADSTACNSIKRTEIYSLELVTFMSSMVSSIPSSPNVILPQTINNCKLFVPDTPPALAPKQLLGIDYHKLIIPESLDFAKKYRVLIMDYCWLLIMCK